MKAFLNRSPVGNNTKFKLRQTLLGLVLPYLTACITNPASVSDSFHSPGRLDVSPNPIVVGQPWVLKFIPDQAELPGIGLYKQETSSKLLSTSGRISFSSFSLNDTGRYFCIIGNTGGGQKTAELRISIEDVVFETSSLRTDEVTEHLRAITGGRRTRIVWLKGGYANQGGGTLVGFDTQSGKTHSILQSSGSMWINRPHLCSGGNKVVFTDTRDAGKYLTYSIDWDGTDLRFLCEGECSDVWLDPSTSQEWAIVRSGGADTAQPVYKIPLNRYAVPVLLWDATGVGSKHSRAWYQVSADGFRAVDCFPWGFSRTYVVFDGGLRANGPVWKAPTDGCWYAMAPDNSYLWFHMYWNNTFNGHTGLEMYRDTVHLGRVELNSRGVPEEHFHVKFAANSSQFMLASTGYGHIADLGSDSAEIVIGRMLPEGTGFYGWAQLTRDSMPDYYPDMWIGVNEAFPCIENGPAYFPKLPPGDLPEANFTLTAPAVGKTYTITDSILFNVDRG